MTKKRVTKTVRAPSILELKSSDSTTRWKIAFFIALLAVVVLAADDIMSATDSIDDTADRVVDTESLDGVIVIEEFSDFQCPFCEKFFTGAYAEMKNDPLFLEGKIKFEYKHFPLSIHPEAQKSAEASECARDQDKFLEYHDILFGNQQSLNTANYKKWAGEIGLDQAKFDSCLDNGDKTQVVLDDFEEGKAKGVTGTPTVFVNGQSIVGAQPWSVIKAAALSGSGSIAAPTQPTPTDPAQPPAAPADDIAFSVIVINDPDCGACDPTQLKTALDNLFPNIEYKEVDSNGDEGAALIAEHSITGLPAFLVEKKATGTANWAQVSRAMDLSGEYYMINPAAYAVGKFLIEPDIEGAWFKGDENAPVTIIEWSDFECPFCGRFYTDTYRQLVSEYIDTGKAKLVYMHFPLDNIHQQARPAALASECAGEQGMFWDMHDKIFENQASLSESNYKVWAGEIGLDQAKFDSCYDSDKYGTKINDDFLMGQQFGISGTPGFLIGTQKISGAQPFSVFQQLIDAQLAE